MKLMPLSSLLVLSRNIDACILDVQRALNSLRLLNDKSACGQLSMFGLDVLEQTLMDAKADPETAPKWLAHVSADSYLLRATVKQLIIENLRPGFTMTLGEITRRPKQITADHRHVNVKRSTRRFTRIALSA